MRVSVLVILTAMLLFQGTATPCLAVAGTFGTGTIPAPLLLPASETPCQHLLEEADHPIPFQKRQNAATPYSLGHASRNRGDWPGAREYDKAATDTGPASALARSSAALSSFQLGESDRAEQELRDLIRRYPLFADARAGLTAVLWSTGQRGEAESHWAASVGLDPCYGDIDWLRQIRGWPPAAVDALEDLLAHRNATSRAPRTIDRPPPGEEAVFRGALPSRSVVPEGI